MQAVRVNRGLMREIRVTMRKRASGRTVMLARLNRQVEELMHSGKIQITGSR